MTDNILTIRPYQGWSPEELHAALDHQVGRAKYHTDIAEIYMRELGMRGVVIEMPEGA